MSLGGEANSIGVDGVPYFVRVVDTTPRVLGTPAVVVGITPRVLDTPSSGVLGTALGVVGTTARPLGSATGAFSTCPGVVGTTAGPLVELSLESALLLEGLG